MQATQNIEAVYRTSPMQQGLLYHAIEAPDAGVQNTCEISGDLNIDHFRAAWADVIKASPRVENRLRLGDRHSLCRLCSGTPRFRSSSKIGGVSTARRSKGWQATSSRIV
jgi:hypothetical protein